MKDIVKRVNQSSNELKVYVEDAFAEIDEDKGFQKVISNISERLQQYMNEEGKQFEHLKKLKKYCLV